MATLSPYQAKVPTVPGGNSRYKTQATGASALAESTYLTPAIKQAIQNQLQVDWNCCPMSELRMGYTLLDLAYYMESSDHLRQSEARRIITTLYEELSLPVVQPNIDAAHAYLVGMFLSGHPIFGVVGEKRERDAQAAQMEAIIEENSRETGWSRQLGMTIKNGLKYNICAVEVDWKVRRTYNLTTDTNISFTQAKVSEAFRAGNELRNWDMYNTAFDTSVSPADVHTTGDYAINVERITLAQCHQRIADLKSNGGAIMGEHELWTRGVFRNWYHIPQLRKNTLKTTGTDWVTFFSGSAAPMSQDAKARFEWVTYYRRIIPSMFGITHVSDKDMLQIWKFVEVNGVLVYAERKSNAHNYLPVVFGQPVEDSMGLQTKGVGSILLPFQNLSDTMFRARIASLARALSDRGLYDPSRIDPKHMNSQLPTAKIPVRPGAYGTQISQAYHQIPYDDRNAQTLYQDIGAVNSWASDAAHINKAQRGQFVKGNRTLQEYNDVMDNADASQQVMAILLEAQVFVPIKTMIKVNILQYQSSGTLTDPNTQSAVEIDPVALRSAILDFKIADGLLSKDKILGIPALIESFQVLSQVQASQPGVTPKYDIISMFVTAMRARGAKLELHEYPPQQLPAPGQPGEQGVPQGAAPSATA